MQQLQGNATRKALVVILAAVLGILPLSACGGMQQPADSANQASSADSSASASDSSKGEKGKTISTPVGNLVCPSNWNDDVQIANNVSSGKGTIDFYGSVNNEQVRLFSLVYGDDSQGYFLGTVPDSSGNQVKVSLDISQIEPGNGWSDSDKSKMNDLQEGVNVLLDQIYGLNGFQSAGNQ